jgi:PKD repeat protein
VTFSDTSTGSPSTWIWDFGNGQVSFERNPEVTFTSAGTYNVLLTVEKGGVQNKKSMTITVSWPPVVTTPAVSSATVVTTPATTAPTAIITTPASSFTGSFVGYWTVSIGSFTQYFIFNMPVGNSIDGTFGGQDFTTGFLDGTLSEGGRTMTGTWENILDDQSGTFSFRLTDANHFTGTWVESGTSYSANGYSEPL